MVVVVIEAAGGGGGPAAAASAGASPLAHPHRSSQAGMTTGPAVDPRAHSGAAASPTSRCRRRHSRRGASRRVAATWLRVPVSVYLCMRKKPKPKPMRARRPTTGNGSDTHSSHANASASLAAPLLSGSLFQSIHIRWIANTHTHTLCTSPRARSFGSASVTAHHGPRRRTDFKFCSLTELIA